MKAGWALTLCLILGLAYAVLLALLGARALPPLPRHPFNSTRNQVALHASLTKGNREWL